MNDVPRQDVAIFAKALELPASERAAFLDRACGDDLNLRQWVDGLLQAHDTAGDFLQNPAPDAVRSEEAPIGEQLGDFIGHYKLLQKIGEGGCGVVYMAEQAEPVRRLVALKVIRPGMDTRNVIARFEAERQALALMDHPNIAKVFDAGATESGRPFFVMELVKGVKITDYCDQESLTTAERLDLFVQVCHAIQHAHQKGIIHRDIKPSNILVGKTEQGAALPMVIDFGIAKATTNQRLTDRTVFTALEMLIGTPAYMSPEQAEMGGVDVDTRTDIYSLGVLAYELLTGSTPFERAALMKAGLDEIRRVIREQEPARPSTRLKGMLEKDLTITATCRRSTPPVLIRALRRDLDWIVMKALEKDRSRRYETANGFALDIQRHLHNEPVLARPPSKLYRLGKLVRRNKLAFAAVGVIAGVLVLGVVTSTWLALRAIRAGENEVRQRRTAQLAQQDAEAVTKYLISILQSPDPNRTGHAVTLEEILDKAVLGLDKVFSGQPAQRSRVQEVIGRTYQSLGLDRRAIPLLEQVRDYDLSQFGLENTNTIVVIAELARSYWEVGRHDEALELHEKVFELRRKSLGPDHPDTLMAMNHLAISYSSAGRREEAFKLLEKIFETRRRIQGPEHPQTLNAMNNLAWYYATSGRSQEALKMQEQVLEVRRRISPEHPDTIIAMLHLARSYGNAGRRDEELKLNEEALKLDRKVLGPEHLRTLQAMANVANSYSTMGRWDEALELREETLALDRKVLGREHPDTLIAMENLAVSYSKAGRQDEAFRLREQVLEGRRKVLGAEYPDTLTAMENLAVSYEDARRWDEALKLREQALEVRRKVLGAEYPDTLTAMEELANSYENAGCLDEGLQLREQVMEGRRKVFGFERPETVTAMNNLTAALAGRGRWKEATSNLWRIIELQPAEHAPYHLLAPVLVASGDLKGYRELCERVLTRFGQTTNASVAERMAKDCLILPGAVTNLAAVGQMADTAVTLGANSVLIPFNQFAKALAEYRQGSCASAVEWANQALTRPGVGFRDVQACMVLAMAHSQLRHYDEARAALARGIEIEQSKAPAENASDLGDDWPDWIIARALMKEAKSLVEGSSPASQ
jgi:serine/threonine protein kinase/tetratricopeptide (TPR) repeat protein